MALSKLKLHSLSRNNNFFYKIMWLPSAAGTLEGGRQGPQPPPRFSDFATCLSCRKNKKNKKVTYIAGPPSIIKGFFRVDARSFTFVRTIFKSTTSWITPFPRRAFLKILKKIFKKYQNKNLTKENMKHTKETITDMQKNKAKR